MKNDIIAKLGNELAVVYLLVDLRKLIEMNKDEATYRPLPFRTEMTCPRLVLVRHKRMHIIGARGPRTERICRCPKRALGCWKVSRDV